MIDLQKSYDQAQQYFLILEHIAPQLAEKDTP